jgi:D-arabinose 1-dehydrogenase-like Zn-dependent alcohol dehydrogenase
VRAARFVGPGRPLEIRDLPEPVPGPSDVVVRVEACGICASDLHLIHGEMPPIAALPLTMGHEASGVIEAVGAHVPSWKPGQRVSVAAGKSCMACPRCASGAFEECWSPQIMGFSYDGAWATKVVVPFVALAAVPANVSFEHAAIACDAVSTPYAALVERAGVRAGEYVGIWGIGGLGTHAVQIARLLGAGFVAAVDPLPAARERALALGADIALDPAADDVVGEIRSATGGRGLDVAADMIGKASVTKQALHAMARGGRIVNVGQSFEALEAGPILVFSVLGLSLLGHLGYRKAHLEQVLDLIARGRLDLSASVSGTLPLDRVQDGVDRLTSKEDSPVRIVVLPQT